MLTALLESTTPCTRTKILIFRDALVVINIRNRYIVRNIEVGGQPDSIAVSPDDRFVAVAIVNGRDEDVVGGRQQQAPPRREVGGIALQH